MCNDLAVMTQALCELQDMELAAFLRRLFAGPRWAMIRKAHPGLNDMQTLQRIVENEGLRVAMRSGPPIVFYADEFDRCDSITEGMD